MYIYIFYIYFLLIYINTFLDEYICLYVYILKENVYKSIYLYILCIYFLLIYIYLNIYILYI